MIKKIKIIFFKLLLSENDKCLINQALNLLEDDIKKECLCDYKDNLRDIDFLREFSKNKLWI